MAYSSSGTFPDNFVLSILSPIRPRLPIMTEDFRPTLTIDRGAIASNWRALNDRSAGGSAAVIKADAYGLGMVECAPALRDAGAQRFFVATLEEGCRLREILGPAPWIGVLEGLSDPSTFAREHLTPVLNTPAQVQAWAQARDSLPDELVIHVDTGMNRLGLSPEAANALFNGHVWLSASRRMLMSHLAEAEDAAAPSNREQLAAFTAAMGQAGADEEGFTASLINSSGHFLGDEFCRIGLGRPGVALYGANPCPERPHPLQPVIGLRAPLIQVRPVPAGCPVGYGGTWTTARDSVLGVLALGYADGWPRAASDRVQVAIDGHACAQVGRVSMDTVVIDLTDLPVGLQQTGQLATVIGSELPLERFADGAGTINYEILTSLSRRAKRVYFSA